jgi:ABC-type transport system involved in multi-copper enzyme maturation permease subunit
MNLTNQTKIYIFTGLLFVFTFLSAKFIISELKSLPTNSFVGGFSIVMAIGLIISIIKLSKIENNK